MEDKLFIIGWGLGGGYGGINNYEVIKVEDRDEAFYEAYNRACECYESYADGNNIRDIDDIMDQDDVDEETAVEIFSEERETWLDYEILDYTPENIEKVKGYHFYDPFSS